MKLTYLSLAVILLWSVVQAPALADDPVPNATPTSHQMMKDCIERQKTADVTMSKSQMRRICKDELKRQKQTGAMPTPPTDAPKP